MFIQPFLRLLAARGWIQGCLVCFVISPLSGQEPPQANTASALATESFDLDIPNQKELTFYIRLPSGSSSKQKPNGVIAICKFGERGLEEDLVSTYGPFAYLLGMADRMGYAVVGFGQPARGAWDQRNSTDEQRRQEARLQDRLMDDLADEWAACMGKVARKYDLPKDGYLMYGLCGGAQYAHRLALRKPEFFKAVHAHYGGSYDTPTDKGASVFWLVTTWEDDIGHGPSQQFCRSSRELGYSIIQRSYKRSQEFSVQSLGEKFFEYAALHSTTQQPPPAYVGDFSNYIAWPAAQAGWLPKSQTIDLPTPEIAALWGEVRK